MKISRVASVAAVAALTITSISGAAARPGAGGGGDDPRLRVAAEGMPGGFGLGGADVTAGVTAGVTPVERSRPPDRSTVTLVTGDRVRLDVAADGRQTATVVPPNGAKPSAASTFTQFTWHGDQYVIPNRAVPYLSQTLDPRLFDVSYLARAKLDDAHTGTLPVTIEQSRDRAAQRLPAVRVSRTSGRSAVATAVKKDAGRFGRLLADRWRAAGTGHAAARIGTLDGVTRISLAPPPGAPEPPEPPGASFRGSAGAPAESATGRGLPFHTLTIDPLDRQGRPGFMLGFVQNLDDARLSLFGVTGDSTLPGPVNLSVPEGHYSVSVIVLSGPADDLTVESALVIRPDVSVRSDRTVTVDARTAKRYEVSLDPSLPAPPIRFDLLGFARGPVGGREVRVEGLDSVGLRLFSYSPFGMSPLYATPTPDVTRGTFGFLAMTELVTDDAGPSADPTYRLVFPDAHRVPSSLTHRISRADLTTVRDDVHPDLSAPGGSLEVAPIVYLPWTVESLGLGDYVPPGVHTDYWYTSAPDITVWQNTLVDVVRRWGARRAIGPGQRIDEEWNKAPAVPAPVATPLQSPPVDAEGVLATVCASCRQDDNGMIYLSPLGDSDPSHYAEVSTTAPTSSVRFWRDGTLAATSDSWLTGTLAAYAMALPMLPERAGYRLEWSWSRPGDAAATVDTDWTFRSGRDDPAARLPAHEYCALDTSRGCSFLPLLFVTYDLPLDSASRAKAGGAFPIRFTVEHEENAPAPRGVTATVSASYDGGRTWTSPRAATADGHGGFDTTITHPALGDTDHYVALRIEARDGAGNTVRQTILRAYALT